ncbi:hypothetical protein [Embleya sp. NPDC059259]
MLVREPGCPPEPRSKDPRSLRRLPGFAGTTLELLATAAAVTTPRASVG